MYKGGQTRSARPFKRKQQSRREPYLCVIMSTLLYVLDLDKNNTKIFLVKKFSHTKPFPGHLCCWAIIGVVCRLKI